MVQALELNNSRVKIQIWDTAGQERFASITKAYFRGAHMCFLIYDITNRDSFDKLQSAIYPNFTQNAGEGCFTVVVGTKSDLTGIR